MVNNETKLDGGTALQPTSQGGVLVVADAAAIELFRAQSDVADVGGLTFLPLDSDAPVADDELIGVRVLVIEVDQAKPQSLARISVIRERHKDLLIIAALRDADIAVVRSLLRYGVTDIVQMPFDPAELRTQVIDAVANVSGGGSLPGYAPMLAIAGSTGGCGTTTVLTHLAAELARIGVGSRGVCVIDLDLQSGEVADYLGCRPKITVNALLDAGERLDADLLHSAVTDSGLGFGIIAAPDTITALDDVDDKQLLKLLDLLRREFDFVLVDLPADWTGWALSVAMASGSVVLVTELSVASLRQAKRRFQLFSSIGMDTGRVRLIANRVERKFFRTVGVSEAEDVLKHKVIATLADEDEAMVEAQNEGKLITQLRRHTKFASDIEALARTILAECR